MKGVIVTYPGTLPSAILDCFPADLKLSFDGFEPEKLPTLSSDSRLFSYSSKTNILTNTPARTLWGFYKIIRCELPHSTYVTSMVNGAHRLNFFNEIWAKVAKEKKLTVLSVDDLVHSPMGFTSSIKRTFGIKWELPSFMRHSHGFEPEVVEIINNICAQGWYNLKGANNG